MLGLSQARLAELSGVSLRALVAIESGGNYLMSTMTRIIAALESEAAWLHESGGISIKPKAEKFISREGDGPSDIAKAKMLLNGSRAARGLPPLKWEDE
jgi:transcriptional regulator with XRE-family HTH domain